MYFIFFFFSSRRRHTRWTGDWSSDVCSSDLNIEGVDIHGRVKPKAKSLLNAIGGVLRVVAVGTVCRPGEDRCLLGVDQCDAHDMMDGAVLQFLGRDLAGCKGQARCRDSVALRPYAFVF